jgi:broad-specificity NMP kinase
MRKIAFSGVPGSGKTSALAEVKKLLALKYRVEDVPDLKPNAPFDFDQKTGFVSQFYFITSQINEENLHAQDGPDFLLCDGSLVDHWLEWRECLRRGDVPARPAGGDSLLEALTRFWLPTYDVVFRLRADAAALKKRHPRDGMREYPQERDRQDDERFLRLVQEESVPSLDVWNHRTIDECAQDVMTRLAEMKLI